MKEELNLQCPYKVFKDKDTSIYSFITKNEIEYKIIFTEITETFNGTTTGNSIKKIFDLTIEKVSKETEPFDPDTGKTINKIAEEFFRDKDNSIFYICEHTDKKQKIRSDTFRKWGDKISKEVTVNHFQRDYKVNYISENHLQYSGIIYHSENIYSKSITVAYNELIDYWDDRIDNDLKE